jgi:hypothetical protein
LRILNHFLPVLKGEDLEKFFFEDEVMPFIPRSYYSYGREGIALDIELIEETSQDIMADQEIYRGLVFEELMKLPKVKGMDY